MKRKFGILILFFLAVFVVRAQDTLQVEKCDTCHSVRKATLLSAVIPGAGQIYNHLAQPKGHKKAYWKVPLIYAGLGGVSYLLLSNQSDVLSLRNEYRYRVANNGATLDNKWSTYDLQGIITLESQKAGNRDYSILGLVLIYAFQVADAAVEAHFVSFDVSEDLSVRIKPWTYQTSTVGLSLQLNFR
ncbi:MAG: DUF5683 domain-containing protein [Crocinitomicaceae bacterium]